MSFKLESGSLVIPMALAALLTGRRISAETCWFNDTFTPANFGSGPEAQFKLIWIFRITEVSSTSIMIAIDCPSGETICLL